MALPVTAAAVLLPSAALACPACFGATDARVLGAYYATAAGLTLLPLVIVGVFAAWLRGRLRDGAPPPGRPSDGR
jgi:hypothetical protein